MDDNTKPLVEQRFLLMKRGLYYRPDNCGYTGFKERAGRYLESEARPASGVSAIHEDEAAEIAPNCFDDLAREYLNGKIERLQALAGEMAGAFPADVRAVMNEMKGDWSIPANQIAADATATSGVSILPARTIKIMRALHELGLAEFGPLYNEDEPKMQGRGYWLSNSGVRVRASLASYQEINK